MGAEQLEEGSFGDLRGKSSGPGAFGAGGGGRWQGLEGGQGQGTLQKQV